MSDPIVPHSSFVRRIKKETHDVFTLWIDNGSKNDKAPTRRLVPGQFNMLYAFGVGEIPISMSGVTHPDSIVHTIRTVGPVTRALARLKKGAMIGLRGPFGTGWPLDQVEGKDVLLIAGGIGLAPLRPALIDLLFNERNPRKVTLIYGTRTPQDVLFRKELLTWERRRGLELLVTIDQPSSDWTGHVGVAPELLSKISFDPSRCVALICGPEVMMRFTIRALRDRGIADSAIFLSMERNMKCAIGNCGRCQFVPYFICKDGPVLSYDRVRPFFGKKEL